jgi:hypothetical protein
MDILGTTAGFIRDGFGKAEGFGVGIGFGVIEAVLF